MAKRNIAKEIEAGMKAILADLDGTGPALKRHFIATPKVSEIRKRMGLSQAEFSDRFGLSRRTVQDWEQDRRKPDQLAAILLHVIDEEPAAVVRVVYKLRGATSGKRPAQSVGKRSPGRLGRISPRAGEQTAAKNKFAHKRIRSVHARG